MELLEAGETMRRLEAAVVEARAFFGIDPLYRTPVWATKSGGAAHIDNPAGYLFAPISVDLIYYQQKPHLIREDMAHEVGHLMSAEIMRIQQFMPEEWRGGPDARGAMLDEAIEMLTVRLEHLFLRERPYAGGGVIHTVPEEPVTLASLRL